MKKIVRTKNNIKVEVCQFSVRDLQEIILTCLNSVKRRYLPISHLFILVCLSFFTVYYCIEECSNLVYKGFFHFVFYESLLILFYIVYNDLTIWNSSYSMYKNINSAVDEYLKTLPENYEYLSEQNKVINKVEIPYLYVTVNGSFMSFFYYKFIKRQSFDTIEILDE